MAHCANAAVVSQYSQLKFVDSPQSPPLPSSVVECRGGRSGYAVNQHSQLRFNMKIPPKSAHMEANFPPRPSPVVIEKGIVSVPNAHTGVSAVRATAHSLSAAPHASLQSRGKVLMSDGLALASWLAKRDLERNRLGALAALQAGSQHSFEMEEREEEEEEVNGGRDPLEDGPSQFSGRGGHWGTQPFPDDLKVQGHPAKGTSRNVHFDTSTRGGSLSSNKFERQRRQPLEDKGRHSASALLDVQQNTFPKSLRHKSSHPTPIALSGRENSITGGAEEREEESVYDTTGFECQRLHKQLLGQFAALEGILRRSVERGGVNGSDMEGGEVEEEAVGRKRTRGKEQLVRSSRTVYNLKQQLQGLTKELDKYHSTSTAARRTRKVHLVQQLLSLFRSTVRSFNALIRTTTQLGPSAAAGGGGGATDYVKHLNQCQEVCGVLKQLTCASLELGVGSQQTTDEVVKRTKAFTAFVQEMVLQQQHQPVEQSAMRGAAPLLHRSDQEGRPPQGKGKVEGRNPARSGPVKGGGGGRRRQPPSKARGVILPLHLRRRIDQREERRRATQPAPPSSNLSKETFSFWLKKHFQQQEDSSVVKEPPPHLPAAPDRHIPASSAAVSKTSLPRNRIQPDLSFEAYHRHATRLQQTEKPEAEDRTGRLEPQSQSPPHRTPPHTSPSHTSPSHISPVGQKRPSEQYDRERRSGKEGGGGVGGAGMEGGERSGEGGMEGVPISSPSWKLMAKELARQIWLDREVLSDKGPKCPGQLPVGSGVSQGRQTSSGPSLPAAPVDGRKENLGHFEGGEGLGGSVSDGAGEESGVMGKVGSEEVGRRACLLMDRPALETMLLRLQEIEDERSRLCHKWSHITYEDPLVSGTVEPSSASRPPEAAAVRKEQSSKCTDIVIEPVAVDQGDIVAHSPDSRVRPVTERNSDSESDESELQQPHVPRQPGRTDYDHGQQRKTVGVSRALKSSIEAYQRQYQRYQQLTCTQAKGDFDPSVLITRVSEAILDDVLEELSVEVMAAGDRMAEELFSKEFARPDTPNDVSSSTHSIPSVAYSTD